MHLAYHIGRKVYEQEIGIRFPAKVETFLLQCSSFWRVRREEHEADHSILHNAEVKITALSHRPRWSSCRCLTKYRDTFLVPVKYRGKLHWVKEVQGQLTLC